MSLRRRRLELERFLETSRVSTTRNGTQHNGELENLYNRCCLPANTQFFNIRTMVEQGKERAEIECIDMTSEPSGRMRT